MKHKKNVTAVFKSGSKTAKTNMHGNNRMSVFGHKSISTNPLDALLQTECVNQPKKPKVKRHAN